MQLNREDGGNRRFLLVEMEPHIARTVTAERLRRVLCGEEERREEEKKRRREDEEQGSAGETKSGLFLAETGQETSQVEQTEASEDSASSLLLFSSSSLLPSGFTYCALGEALFDAEGKVSADVEFGELARHIFYTETGQTLPRHAQPAPPLLGIADTTAVYLLWNGREAEPLTAARLRYLPPHNGPKVIYAASCRLPRARLQRDNITFRQFPYQVRMA